MRLTNALIIAAFLSLTAGPAAAEDIPIKIGVLNDRSGVYADLAGEGSVIAARMAVEDFGAAAKGIKVEIISADHQNKPDIASNIARQWIDQDGVDVIADVPDLLGGAGGQRGGAREEQDLSRDGRGNLGSDRPQMLAQYGALDL